MLIQHPIREGLSCQLWLQKSLEDTQEEQCGTQHPQRQRAGQDRVVGMPPMCQASLKGRLHVGKLIPSSFCVHLALPILPPSLRSPNPDLRVLRVLNGWGQALLCRMEMGMMQKRRCRLLAVFRSGGFCSCLSSVLPSCSVDRV